MRQMLIDLVNEYFDEAEHQGIDIPKTMGGLIYDLMIYNKYRD